MEKNYVQKQVIRVCRNKIILLSIISLFIFFFILGSNPDILKIFGKDTKIKNYQEIQNNFKNGNLYATEKNTKINDTGFFNRSSENGTTYYYVITIDDHDVQKYIFYKSNKKYNSKETEQMVISGKLKSLSTTDRQVYNKSVNSISTSINISLSDAREYIASDIIIDGTSSKFGEIILIIVTGAIICGLIILFSRQIIFIKDYKKHKICKRIEEDTNKEIEVLADKVKDELSKDNLILNKRNIKITDSYIVSPTAYNFKLRLKNDLIWAYYNETKHYTNGIPSGSTFNIYLYLNKNNKDLIVINVGNKKKTLAVIETLAEKIDTAMFGYTDELKKLHNTNFQEFLNIVEEYQNKGNKKENN